MSSLEAALTSTIDCLIPGAGWLAENLPTPPVVRLLDEYIPMLPVRNTIDGKVLAPAKEIIELIKKGVTIRNRVLHVGGKPPNAETLSEILRAIKDTIWLLDFYCGQKWAYDFIAKETRQKLEET